MARVTEAAKARKREYDLAYSRERRKWLSDQGFCEDCGSAWAEPGHTRCKACRERQKNWRSQSDPNNARFNARRNKIRAERRAAGLCPMCGATTDGVHVMCEICRQKQRLKEQVNRIQKRIEREADNARKGVYTR